ncbi:MAG: hypothetical protein CL927_06095 [Deltaproteobacteria bacterium]|nr:hypothetical protein [Deltaproteobacteria bacterium]HCH66138.1 hypothetical protein [Deltaproteobacteria bacterium]
MSLLAVLFVAATTCSAEPIGTYRVSSWDTSIDGGEARTVRFKIHYPAVADSYGADADNTAGPFPVVGFMHGYLGSAWMYTETADALASTGAVVLNLDIETGFSIDTTRMALGMQALLWWVDDNSQDAEHWLYGMSDGGAWAVGGHSMGGVALAELVGLEPRVQTVVGYMPYEPDGEQWLPYDSFTGTALMLAGSEDTTSTPEMVELWHDRLAAADRSLYLNLEGAGHQAVSNFAWGEESMGDDEQRDLVIALSADLLEANRTGDDTFLQSVLCDLPAPAAPHRSVSHRPVTIAQPEGATTLRLSLGGLPDTEAVVFAGRGPDTTNTELGPIDLRSGVEVGRFVLEDGIACGAIELPDELASLAWIQVAHRWSEAEVVLGAPIDVFGVGDPGPIDDPEPGEDSEADEDPGAEEEGESPTEPGGDADTDASASGTTDESDVQPSTATAPGAQDGKVAGCATRGRGGIPSGFGVSLGLLALLGRRRR